MPAIWATTWKHWAVNKVPFWLQHTKNANDIGSGLGFDLTDFRGEGASR